MTELSLGFLLSKDNKSFVSFPESSIRIFSFLDEIDCDTKSVIQRELSQLFNNKILAG